MGKFLSLKSMFLVNISSKKCQQLSGFKNVGEDIKKENTLKNNYVKPTREEEQPLSFRDG